MVDTTWRRTQRSAPIDDKKLNSLDQSNATKQSSPIKDTEPLPASLQTTVKPSTPHKNTFNPISSSTPNLARRAVQRASTIKTPTLTKRTNKLLEPTTETGWATIKDLKQEEKQKIANLVSELAKANKEKEEIKLELEKLRAATDSEIDDLKDNNTQLIQDLANLQKKFNHSLSLLKNYQEKLQVKGSPSPIAKQSPVRTPPQNLSTDDKKLDLLQAEIMKLKQVVANQEHAIVNLSKTHSSIEVSNNSIEAAPSKSPITNIFQTSSYIPPSQPDPQNAKNLNFDKYLTTKGAPSVTLLQSNNKRRLRTMIENSQQKKEIVEAPVPAVKPERELKEEKSLNQSIQPRHVRFSSTEAELTPSKTFRMSKLLSIQGKRDAPLSEANNGQKVTAQMNGNSKNMRNAPVVEQEEEMLLRSIEKQQGVKQVKELKQKSVSKWDSFDRHWDDFETYVNKPKWAEPREDSKPRKILQETKESEVSYDKSLIDLIDELESENL